MSDESDPKENNLVPAGNKALTTRSSALVKRGLDALVTRKPRIVRFPPDRSLGQYAIFDSDINISVTTVSNEFKDSNSLKFIAPAKGTVALQPGQVLCLKVDDSVSKDSASFSILNPDDVHTLLLESSEFGDKDLV